MKNHTCTIEHEYHVFAKRLAGSQTRDENIDYPVSWLGSLSLIVLRLSGAAQASDHKLFVKRHLEHC
jgi:hypothetical protein